MLSTGSGAGALATLAAQSMTANATPKMHKNPAKKWVNVFVKYRGFIVLLKHYFTISLILGQILSSTIDIPFAILFAAKINKARGAAKMSPSGIFR